MKQKIISVLLAVLMLFTSAAAAYAESIEDFLGTLTSLFRSEDEITYSVGEAVTVGGATLTLKNVLQSKGSSSYKPADGKEFLILELLIENTDSEDLSISSMLSFSLSCDDVVYSISFDALATALFAGKAQLDCSLNPGEKYTGVVGYEVPIGWKNLRLQYNADVYFGETATFAVQR